MNMMQKIQQSVFQRIIEINPLYQEYKENRLDFDNVLSELKRKTKQVKQMCDVDEYNSLYEYVNLGSCWNITKKEEYVLGQMFQKRKTDTLKLMIDVLREKVYQQNLL